MKLKVISTGSTGNSYILTNNQNQHLIIDAGLPIGEIKKGLDYDLEHVVGAVISHSHKDHCLSVPKLKNMGIPCYEPYKDRLQYMKTKLGNFSITSFPVPHHGTENRGFLITSDNTVFCYLTDLEYLPYDLSSKGINILLIELNYQKDRVDESTHLEHTVLGHLEQDTAIDIMAHYKDTLRKVILCHMSQSGALNRELAMKKIREAIPDYIEVDFAKPNTEYNLNECPF